VTQIRILTVRQPWAWAIIAGYKPVENRSRLMTGGYRGPVAIHSGLKPDNHSYFDPLTEAAAQDHMAVTGESCVTYEYGVILGVADLTDEHMHGAEGVAAGWGLCSKWAWQGMAHLRFENPRRLPKPVPWIGRLGLGRLDTAEVPGLEELLHA
jgi:hypothetical protein